MRRAILVPLFVLAAVSLACSLFTSTPKAPPTAAVVETPQEVVAGKATEAPVSVKPTSTKPAVEAPKVVLATAINEATDTPEGPVVYTESFDKRNDYWSDPVVVTSQASGRDPFIKINVDKGVMRFAIQDKETYVYKFFLYTVEGDGAIEVSYEPRGAQNNAIAVVCKADEDLNEWFEVRLLSGQSEVNFYHYNKKLKTDEGKNPYVLLSQEKLSLKEFSPGKGNPFRVNCTDEQLTVDINNGKRVISVDVDAPLSGQIVGIGAMSYDVIPVTMDFDSVVITQDK